MRRFRRFRLRWPFGGGGGGRGSRVRLHGLRGPLRWLLILAVGYYLVVRLVELAVLQPLSAVAETEARLRGIDAVNRVVLGSIGANLKHEDLVTYMKDHEGRIAAYHINTRLINTVASEAAAAVTQEFTHMAQNEFGVPMGVLSGTRLLATEGPAIPVRLMPIGTVAIDIQQEFKAEGINQTRHRIWLHATARVRVILPILTRETEVTADLPLSETVIVGPVPGSFYGGRIDGLIVPVPSSP